MYSVVLMMAMTTGAETPDCHRKHGCHGCSGYTSCGGGGCYGGGCYGGGVGCYGGGVGCYGGTYMAPAVKPEEVKKMPKPPEAAISAPARIVVSLPADAKLTIDGTSTNSISSQRVFESPVLPPNRDFHYTLRAEVMRDGKPVSVEQLVEVRAGRESRVILSLPQGVASR